MRKIPAVEIYRKLIHAFFGIMMPALMFYVPRLVDQYARNFPDGLVLWIAPIGMGLISAGFLGVELLRMAHRSTGRVFDRAFGSMLRKDEQRSLTGATYIAFSGFACAALFFNRPEVTFMALAAFMWGDAAAALVGQQFGRIRIGKKSIEGSIGCFVVCLVLYLWVFPIVPGLLDHTQGDIPLWIALAASVSTTLVELFPLRFGKLTLNDNFSAPVLTGATLLVLLSV